LAKKNKQTDPLAKLVALCKRRGIVFQSSEIYGGVGSTYDYGPYGVEIKNNISRLWWDEMTRNHENIVGLDSAVILHPQVWEASGHLREFHDPLIDCKKCKNRLKVDTFISSIEFELFHRSYSIEIPFFTNIEILSRYFIEALSEYITTLGLSDEERKSLRLEIFHDFKEWWLTYELDEGGEGSQKIDRDILEPVFFEVIEKLLTEQNQYFICPICRNEGTFTVPRDFQLMFQTNQGPTAEPGSEVYLRPETCQGIFLDWKTVQESARLKVPFGIAQIGKAFRNEITTGNFIFRTREFTQMEMQYFVKPGETSEALKEWKEKRWNFYLSLGIDAEKLRWLQHPQDKLAHYAKEAWDIEYLFPFGWGEVEGIHDRCDFDLKAHQEASRKDMTYFDDQTHERFHPQIVETSAGLNRMMLAVLWDAYREDEQAGESRTYLALDPKIAPVKAAVYPLVKKGGLPEIARSIYEDLHKRWRVFYDFQGSIGKRYRRMDEIGTPFGITVDFQTLEDNTVTVRWRDTLQQERIDKDQVGNYISDKLGDI